MTKNQITLSLPYAVIEEFAKEYKPESRIEKASISSFGNVNYFTVSAYLRENFGDFFQLSTLKWDDTNEVVYINHLVLGEKNQ